jgi:hypothetical protein
MGKPVPYGK